MVRSAADSASAAACCDVATRAARARRHRRRASPMWLCPVPRLIVLLGGRQRRPRWRPSWPRRSRRPPTPSPRSERSCPATVGYHKPGPTVARWRPSRPQTGSSRRLARRPRVRRRCRRGRSAAASAARLSAGAEAVLPLGTPARRQALGRVRRIVEADPAFHERLAQGTVAPELVDDIGSEWLQRHDGSEGREFRNWSRRPTRPAPTIIVVGG